MGELLLSDETHPLFRGKPQPRSHEAPREHGSTPRILSESEGESLEIQTSEEEKKQNN